MDQPYPILEYDPDPEAVIEPRRLIQPQDVPTHCVICPLTGIFDFFREVITELAQHEGVRQIAASRSEMGEHPLYELVLDGRPPAPCPPPPCPPPPCPPTLGGWGAGERARGDWRSFTPV